MAGASTSSRGRLAAFALSESWRSLAQRLHSSAIFRLRYYGRVPDRLLIAPTDLRTADPTVAQDIYAGRFVFSGEIVDTHGLPVFTLPAPTPEWARQLHGFGWLRHLRASDMTLSHSNARALIADWIRVQGRHDPEAYEPSVVARRVMSWLSQTPLILEGCDYAFHIRFMRALTGQVRHLRRIAPTAPVGLPRLRVMVTLAAAALAMPEQERFVRQAVKWLDVELDRQILPDGGHISRNPRALLELLVDLLPVRQAFTARGIQPSRTVITAIDRMMPMLRFFRHGDGSFGRFNGMGDAPSDLVATVLAYDDARGKPVLNAPHSGYQRLSAGPTLILMDTGTPPPIAVSASAHAGCLSFELSVGRQPVVINCGAPAAGATRLRRLSRLTAAHSTATLADTSSCRFLARPSLSDRLGHVIVSGPSEVSVERGQDQGATVVLASHDGYLERFGMVHERRLRLSATGDRLDGEDVFSSPAGRRSGAEDSFYAIRFHLHPSVTPSAAGQRMIELVFPDGEIWGFETNAGQPLVEDSILFSDVRGNRATRQIVVHGNADEARRVAWRFRRVGYRGRVRPPDQRPT